MANEKDDAQPETLNDLANGVYDQLLFIAGQDIDKSFKKIGRSYKDEAKEALILFRTVKLTDEFGSFGKLLKMKAINRIVDRHLDAPLSNGQVTLTDAANIIGAKLSWLSDYRDLAIVLDNNLLKPLWVDIENLIKKSPSNYRDIIPLLSGAEVIKGN